MSQLDRNAVRTVLAQGVAPISRRIESLKNPETLQAWQQFAESSAKKLLDGEITVDAWKGGFGAFCAELATTVGGVEGEAIWADAQRTMIAVEEVFDPPSPMRWLLFGGVAATAFAYWWLKREEKEQGKLTIATPQLVAGTPRKKRPATTEIVDAEFEEI